LIDKYEFHDKENKKHEITDDIVNRALRELIADHYFIYMFKNNVIPWEYRHLVIGSRAIQHYNQGLSFEFTHKQHITIIWSIIAAIASVSGVIISLIK